MTTTQYLDAPLSVNHFPVLASKSAGDNGRLQIVLCFNQGAFHPFITWFTYTNDGETWDAESGGYHADLRAALDDFDRR